MSKRIQALRALVTERLTAAAEEIFALVERTIAEYEVELCENQRRQQLLEENQSRLTLQESPQVLLHRTGDSQKPFLYSPSISETTQYKEELLGQGTTLFPIVKIKVKREELPSPFQHRQTEHLQADNDEEPPASTSAAQMETEADGDHYNQVQIKHTSPAAHNSNGAGWNHECPFCSKSFATKQRLQVHTRVHTGERPFSCTVCNEAFAAKGHLKDHMRVHTGEKPYSCSICEKTFARQFTLQGHMRTHTGERPYSCSECNATFSQRPHLTKHMWKHKYDQSNNKIL